MEIIIPQDYIPARDCVLYNIINDNDTIQNFEFEILDNNGDLMGTKSFESDTSFGVNVSAYLRTQLKLTPAVLQRSKISVDREKSIRIGIRFRSEEYFSIHLMGNKPVGDKIILSDQPKIRHIHLDQQDEITFMAPEGRLNAEIFIHNTGKKFILGSIDIDEKVPVTIIINGNDLKDFIQSYDYRNSGFQPSFTVNIIHEETLIDQVNYHIISLSGLRVGWWNVYGAIDYASFSVIDEKKAIISDGSLRLYYSVSYPAFSEEKNLWITQLLDSPKIWMLYNNAYLPASIEVDSINIDTYNSPQKLIFSSKINYL
ncbi:MAG: hypothetical protein LUF90_08010 [Rikenellaceae bacterium]|nr:hypothetical protein [Rikenellaceae bacterium]